MALTTGDFDLGQTVKLQDGRRATVRYIGNPHFAPGAWLGVELDEATGKNDGAVQGERYFECEPAHGMFVRPVAASIVEESQVVPNGKINGGHVTRPLEKTGNDGLRRQTLAGIQGKRQSVSAGISTANSRSTSTSRHVRSPIRSPTKQPSSRASSGTSTNQNAVDSSKPVLSRPNTHGRPSMGPPSTATRSSRPSMAGLAITSDRGAAVNTTRGARVSLRPGLDMKLKQPSLRSVTSQGSEGSEKSTQKVYAQLTSRSPPSAGTPDGISPETISPLPSFESAAGEPVPLSRPLSPRDIDPLVIGMRRPVPSGASTKEIEEMKAKLRVMEKKRLEDRDRLRTLEKIQGERDKFEGIIQKLQAKYQPQQQEIADLRKRLREADIKLEETETQRSEHDVVVEMATLDREMAEETSEALKTELETLKQRLEELQLEVEVLREENKALGEEMTPEERASQGWLSMERNNERLREALMRLRDLSKQQEAELKSQVRSLEEDVQELSGVKEQYEATKEKLKHSEASIEELRQQLDTALGAEEMIEELTESNMNMSEKIDELRANIEDLESLKELNDELEINHLETEKQLQEEIDYREALMAEQTRRAQRQQEAIEDYDYTVARFRTLVTELQSDLEDMRASQLMTETEAEELTNRSRAMMDLNMKLQVSASKTQIKSLDLELRRLEAQEAAEHLAIIRLFLPEAFQADRDSVLALLRFRRVAFKAQLVHGFMRERVAGQVPSGQEDELFAGCDALNKLTWVSAMCDRFINSVNSSSISQFSRLAGALYELEPVERTLNGLIDGLRRDELEVKQCAAQLQRSIAVMSHLAEMHATDGLESYANDIQMRTFLTQSYLESTASAMSRMKEMVQNKVSASGVYEGVAQDFARRIDGIIAGFRSAKVMVSKNIRALGELKARSLSLAPDTLPLFELCEDISKALAECSRTVGQDIWSVLNEEGRREACTYDDIQAAISSTASRAFEGDDEKDFFNTLSHNTRILMAKLGEMNNLTSDLSRCLEFERPPAPWVVRAQALKAAQHIPEDMDEQMRKLKDAVHESATQLKLRDKALEESAVKVELFEARMRDASKKTDKIAELERSLGESRRREAEIRVAMETQIREQRNLDSEQERWRRKAEANGGAVGGAHEADGSGKSNATTTRSMEGSSSPATIREVERLQREIHHLQSAVRYFREDNDRLRLSDVLDPGSSISTTSWLHTPFVVDKPEPDSSSATKARARLIRAEGHNVLHEILRLDTTLYDLRQTPKSRLAWRPAKSTAQWHVRRQREEWETWREWIGDVVRRGEGCVK